MGARPPSERMNSTCTFWGTGRAEWQGWAVWGGEQLEAWAGGRWKMGCSLGPGASHLELVLEAPAETLHVVLDGGCEVGISTGCVAPRDNSHHGHDLRRQRHV